MDKPEPIVPALAIQDLEDAARQQDLQYAQEPSKQNRIATELDYEKMVHDAWWPDAKKEIMSKEGFRAEAYKAPEWEKGEPLTVGFGHLLADDDDAKAIWEKVFGDEVSRSAVIAQTRKLTKEEGKRLLEEDMRSRLAIIRKKGNLPDFDWLPKNIKIGTLSLWFQGALAGSPKTLKAIRDAQKTNSPGAWQGAAEQFLDRSDYLELTDADDHRPNMPKMARWAPGLELRYEQFAKDLWHMDVDPDYNLPGAIDAGLRPSKKGAHWPTRAPASHDIWHMDKSLPHGGYYETVDNPNWGEILKLSGHMSLDDEGMKGEYAAGYLPYYHPESGKLYTFRPEEGEKRIAQGYKPGPSTYEEYKTKD